MRNGRRPRWPRPAMPPTGKTSPLPSWWSDSCSPDPRQRKARASVVRRSTRAHFQPSKEGGSRNYMPQAPRPPSTRWEDLRSVVAIVGDSMDKVDEAELLAAASAGQILDCSDGDNRRPVDAALVRRCCHRLKDQIDPRGVQLRNATVAGVLDLADLDVPFPLRFDDCDFDSPVRAEGARIQEL